MHTNTQRAPEPETRPYPYDCRSAYCARTERAAVRLDESWAPGTWTATR